LIEHSLLFHYRFRLFYQLTASEVGGEFGDRADVVALKFDSNMMQFQRSAEIEVKRTFADFKNDLLRIPVDLVERYEGKHSSLNLIKFDGSARSISSKQAKHLCMTIAPKEFPYNYYYYAVPPFLVERVRPLIPKYAGLISISDDRIYDKPHFVIRGKRLNNNPPSQMILKSILLRLSSESVDQKMIISQLREGERLRDADLKIKKKSQLKLMEIINRLIRS
jgi:hypothetical protein